MGLFLDGVMCIGGESGAGIALFYFLGRVTGAEDRGERRGLGSRRL